MSVQSDQLFYSLTLPTLPKRKDVITIVAKMKSKTKKFKVIFGEQSTSGSLSKALKLTFDFEARDVELKYATKDADDDLNALGSDWFNSLSAEGTLKFYYNNDGKVLIFNKGTNCRCTLTIPNMSSINTVQLSGDVDLIEVSLKYNQDRV